MSRRHHHHHDNTLRLGPGDELQMFATPDAWPHPFLPLKCGEQGPSFRLGIMVAHPDVPRTRIFLTHMFDKRLRKLIRRGDPSDLCFEDYPSLEAIVRAGWIVD